VKESSERAALDPRVKPEDDRGEWQPLDPSVALSAANQAR